MKKLDAATVSGLVEVLSVDFARFGREALAKRADGIETEIVEDEFVARFERLAAGSPDDAARVLETHYVVRAERANEFLGAHGTVNDVRDALVMTKSDANYAAICTCQLEGATVVEYEEAFNTQVKFD